MCTCAKRVERERESDPAQRRRAYVQHVCYLGLQFGGSGKVESVKHAPEDYVKSGPQEAAEDTPDQPHQHQHTVQRRGEAEQHPVGRGGRGTAGVLQHSLVQHVLLYVVCVY